MSNWFKKLFGGKCNCENCDCEEKKEEASVAPAVSEITPEITPEINETPSSEGEEKL